MTSNVAFESVIRSCAQARGPERDTWISDEIIVAYTRLHRLGLAHSLEAWTGTGCGEANDGLSPRPAHQPTLAGGLYGVALGKAFFGESMFSRVTDASKVCLVYLVAHLRRCGYHLLDVQFTNPHLEQFGVVEISRDQYLQRLEEAIVAPDAWQPLDGSVEPNGSPAS